jgi:hypothetical protein
MKLITTQTVTSNSLQRWTSLHYKDQCTILRMTAYIFVGYRVEKSNLRINPDIDYSLRK